jgi:cbb3-type cytochrome oxidase cytochrome c subunit
MSYLVASIGGVAFFVLSVSLLGVWPGRVLEDQTRAMSPESPLPVTTSEARGRTIYGREGCAYCHTQQIRYVDADVRRFGAPTLAWETRLDYPHLWGTRRIGPDLARAGATRSDDWHYAHLFAPRTVVRDSVMPPYAWLFDGSPTRPGQSARDLVAYLQSLGRARAIAGPEGEAHARAACNCPDDHMAQMAFRAPLNASPARTRRGGADAPALVLEGDTTRGADLYAANCAGCHGSRGDGMGPAAAWLLPRPAVLAEHDYTVARVADALWNGVAGTSMQAWRYHSVEDLAAIARVVRGFRADSPEPGLPDTLQDLGQRVYETNCAQCHGTAGAGDGSAADELAVAPTNFQVQRPTLGQSLRAVRNGVEGTRMASWTGRLTEAELLAAASHVRALFQGNPAPVNGGAP